MKEEEKEKSESLYRWIMKQQETNEGRKNITFARIACKYEDVINYTHSKVINPEELKYRIQELKEYIKTLCERYCISSVELSEYLTRKNYAMDF